MLEISKTSPNPGPDPGLYGLQRTSDTKSIKQKREGLKLSKIFITKSFKTLLSFEIQSPDPKLAKKPDPHPLQHCSWERGN